MIRWWTRPFYLKFTYVDRYIKETNGIPSDIEVVEVKERHLKEVKVKA